MKRISIFALAALLMFGSMPEAQASNVDVKMRGLYEFAFNTMQNRTFADSANWSTARYPRQAGVANSQERRQRNDNFEARQRMQIWADFVASENLSGTVHFRIGQTVWGRSNAANTGGGAGGALDTDGVNIRVRQAYIDWLVPNTRVSVRMGLQTIALPATRLGSNVLNANVAGVTVASPITDWMRVTAFWIRPYHQQMNDQGVNDGFNTADGNGMLRWGGLSRNVNTASDFFGLVLPMNFTGVRVSPWAMYGRVGAASGHFNPNGGQAFNYRQTVWDHYAATTTANDPAPGVTSVVHNLSVSNKTANVFYLGANLNVTILDPLVFGMDMAYGRIGRTKYGGLTAAVADNPNQRNRAIDGDTPFRSLEASGWYIGATLDYRMSWGTPGIFGWYGSGDSLGDRQNGKIGRMPNMLTPGGNFRYSTFGGTGMFGLSQEAIGNVTGTGTGTWGVGIQVANVSFVKNLSHVLRFAYVRGTNDAAIPKAVLHDSIDNFYGGRANARLLPAGQNALLQWGSDTLYLTTKDSVFEINFDHQYRIYENLTAALELGYMRLSSDVNTWGSDHRLNAPQNRWFERRHTKGGDNAWKANLMFNYSF